MVAAAFQAVVALAAADSLGVAVVDLVAEEVASRVVAAADSAAEAGVVAAVDSLAAVEGAGVEEALVVVGSGRNSNGWYTHGFARA